MKNLIKKTALLIASILCISGCSSTQDPYPYGDTFEPRFEMTKIHHEVDSNIKMDGVLDDEPYKNLRWLNAKKVSGGEWANIDMVLYYGQLGLYVAIDVTENTEIHVNPNRGSFLNSGIELYLAKGDVTTIDCPNSFEIDMDASGGLFFKRNGGPGLWADCSSFDSINPFLATTRKTDVNGYTHELMIPYDFLIHLGYMEENEELNLTYCNPVHICSYSENGDDSNTDRYWFNTSEANLDGDGWSIPSQNYHFDRNGLVAYDIKSNIVGNGSIKTSDGNDYVVANNSYKLQVETGEGFTLKSLVVNGEDKKDSVIVNDGKGILPLPATYAKNDVEISAEFVEIGMADNAFTGLLNITASDGVDVVIDDMSAYFTDGFNNYNANIVKGTTNKITANLPKGDVKLIIKSIKGSYKFYEKKFNITGTTNARINISDNEYGDKRIIHLSDALSTGSEEQILDTPMNVTIGFVSKFFMGVTPESKTIDDAYCFVETLFFRGDNGAELAFQLINWYGRYVVKVFSGSQETAQERGLSNPAIQTLNSMNGLYFEITFNSTQMNIYTSTKVNGEMIKTLALTYSTSAFFRGLTAVSSIAFKGAEGCDGDHVAYLHNAYVQAVNDIDALENIVPDISCEEGITVEGIKAIYKYNESIVFSVKTDDGSEVKVLYNGRPIVLDGNLYVVKADLGINLVITKIKE